MKRDFMKKRIPLAGMLLLFILGMVPTTYCQLTIPDWPTLTGYLQTSTHFAVQVRQGNSAWLDVDVLMTESQDELIPHYPEGIYKNRSFSFAPFSFDPAGGTVTVKVTKLGFPNEPIAPFAQNVEVYNYNGNKQRISNETITFDLTESKYCPVIFAMNANKNATTNSSNLSMPNGNEPFFVWKHMLTIFADGPENLVEPTGNDVVVVDDLTEETDFLNGGTIVFRKGYYDIRNQFGSDFVKVTNGTTVWLAPDAIISGTIHGANSAGQLSTVNNVQILGKGLLYAGEFRNTPSNCDGPYWNFPATCPDHTNNSLPAMIDLHGTNNTVDGPMIGDIYFHGVVPGTAATIENTKIWGWHWNCDGFRPGNLGSTVNHCFIRATDDALYAFNVTVSDVVFWQSFNGSIATHGWGAGFPPYNSGNFKMENCIQVYPEWVGRGNNNGLLMSQLNYDQFSENVTISNFRIFGGSPILLNLKLYSGDLRIDMINGGISNDTLNKITLAGTLSSMSSGILQPSLISSNSGPPNFPIPEFNTLFPISDIVLNSVEQTHTPSRNYNSSDLSNTNLFSVSPTNPTPPYPITVIDDTTSNDFYLVNLGRSYLRFTAFDGTTIFRLNTDESKHARWVKNYDLVVGNEIAEYFYLENVEFNNRRLKVTSLTSFDLTNDDGYAVQWRKVAVPNGNGSFYLENRANPNRYLSYNGFSFSLVLSTNAGTDATWFDDYNIRNAEFLVQPIQRRSPSIMTIQLFPNPVEELLHIRIPSSLSPIQLKILDLQGRVLFQSAKATDFTQVSVANFPDGVYMIQLIEQGKIHVEQFVKATE